MAYQYTYNQHTYVLSMYVKWIYVGELSSDRRSMVARLSSDCRPMDGRWSTDAKQKCSHEWSAVHFFNVNARRRPIWESRTG